MFNRDSVIKCLTQAYSPTKRGGLFHAYLGDKRPANIHGKIELRESGTMLDKLNERLKELDLQRQKAITRLQHANADIIAIDGAIQEVNYWLKKLEDCNGHENQAEVDN